VGGGVVWNEGVKLGLGKVEEKRGVIMFLYLFLTP